jgi:protein-tyrosine kinase
MSKFFNETKKAQDWKFSEGLSERPDLSRVIEAIQEPLGLLKSAKDDGLRGCRRVRLPESSESPALYAQNDFTNIAAESYRTLRTRLLRLQAQRGLRSVVISSAVPGEGKTLTSLNLALCCSQLPRMRVLVVDGDLRTRGLTALLGNLPSPGLGEILTGEVLYDGAVLATDLPNLYVLGGGSVATPASGLYEGERWKEFIGWSIENFDLVLVDSPPMLPLADFEQIAAACDGILIVVRALHAEKELLAKASKMIDAKKLLGVVLNASPLDLKDVAYNYYGAYSSKG